MIWPVVVEVEHGVQELKGLYVHDSDTLTAVASQISGLLLKHPVPMLNRLEIYMAKVSQSCQTKLRRLRTGDDLVQFNKTNHKTVCFDPKIDPFLTKISRGLIPVGGLDHMAYYGAILDVTQDDRTSQFLQDDSKPGSAGSVVLLVTSSVDTSKITLLIAVMVVMAAASLGVMAGLVTHTVSVGVAAAGLCIAYSAFVVGVFQAFKK